MDNHLLEVPTSRSGINAELPSSQRYCCICPQDIEAQEKAVFTAEAVAFSVFSNLSVLAMSIFVEVLVTQEVHSAIAIKRVEHGLHRSKIKESSHLLDGFVGHVLQL
jgi:hypothetical protein